MTLRNRATLFSSAFLALSLSATGCTPGEMDDDLTEAEVIGLQLEEDYGGLEETDEAPFFSDQALFDEAGISDMTEVPVTDALETDTAVTDMIGAPDAALYHTTFVWGQIPADLNNDTAYNWSGEIRVNRGAILVRSALRFDGVTDHLIPRDAARPDVVVFDSATRPHRDGLRLLIIDPNPAALEPLIVTYAPNNGAVFEAPMAALLEGPQARVMDDFGNRIVAVAVREPVDTCDYGFLGGRWHKVADGRGRILGRVVNSDGEIVGHMRGIYGRRDNGERVFFAKFINRAGEFRGILHGNYAEGNFMGRWRTRDGDIGGLRGEYIESAPGPRHAGHYLGRWAETRCNIDSITDRP